MESDLVTVRAGDVVQEFQIGEGTGDIREKRFRVFSVVLNGSRMMVQLQEVDWLGNDIKGREKPTVTGYGLKKGKRGEDRNSIRIPTFHIDNKRERAVFRTLVPKKEPEL